MVTVQTAGTFARYKGGGLFRAIDGSGWLFAELPAQPPVRDAGGKADLIKAARPLLTIMDGLAGLVPTVTVGGRRFAKNFYRRMKILAIATPEPFLPSPTLDPANRVRLARENPHASEHDRFTAVGVKLFAAGGGHGFWAKAADFIDSMAVDNDPASTPDTVFDADREVIQQIFDDAGCAPIGRHQADRMLAWWVTDRSPEVVRVMTEPAHMHVFPSNEACATAEEFKRLHIPCDEWADHIDGSYTMTMVTLGATSFMGTSETDPSAAWAAQLLAARRGGGTGVITLSVDGLVEPGEVSRAQVDKDKEDVIEKTMKQMQDSHKANLKVAQELTQADQEYQSRERAWPTLIEGRVHAAVGHRVLNAKSLGFPGDVKLNPDRQDSVFQDMMIGSTIQYNPSPVFWPAPILAFAGLSGRSVGFLLGEGRPPLDLEFAPGETLPLIGDAVTLGIRPEALGDEGEIHLADAEVTVVEALGRETLVYSDARALRTTDSESLDGYFAQLVPSQSDKRLGQHIALRADRSAFVVFAADGATLHDASPIHHK